jgi:NADPH:quinone reductase-like Zn-dependent oxidoreductase
MQTTKRTESSRTAAETTMTAVVQSGYGATPEPVLSVGDIERPVPRKGEVLVRVRAASVDRGTWHLMAGLAYPVRLVFGLRRPKFLNPGRTFAEYAIVPAAKLAPKPANLSFDQAATVPVSASTALQAVRDHAQVQAGEKVLVIGASGGVGGFAVQIAKAFGAEVTGVASTAKLDSVRALGADAVIDYTREDVGSLAERFDVVLDIAGNRSLAQLRRVLTPHGRLVIVGGETGGKWLDGLDRQLRAVLLNPFVGQRLGFFLNKENAADLRALAELIEAGRVTPLVDRTYPLRETAAAIRHLIDGRATGKIAITV